MAIWCLLNWAGFLYVLSLHIAQKAELNHDYRTRLFLSLLGAEESGWLIDSDVQTPELQLWQLEE